jgi:hypothetical protein
MGKYGVGIGDEFPIEDQAPPEQGSGASGNPDEQEYERQREAWRKAREAWREQRMRWREEWRARWREHRRQLREEMRARYGEDAYSRYGYGHGYGGWQGRSGDGRFIWQGLMIAGLVALAIAIFSHLYIVFGLAVLAALYYAYHRDVDYFDFMGPMAPPRPSQAGGPTPPASAPTSTPPAPPPAETP